MCRIKAGLLPVLEGHGFPLRQKEIAHFLFSDVDLFQPQIINGREELARIDSGTLMLTSGRLIFSAPQRSFSLTHDKILHVAAYADAVGITCDSASEMSKRFVFTHEDPELMAAAIFGCRAAFGAQK